MKVLKFGGTSVGTVESILQVKKIVEKSDEPVIVVVSALGGLTDRLISTAGMAASGDQEYHTEWQQIADRHFDMIDKIISDSEKKEKLLVEVSELLEKLHRILKGIELIESLPPQTLDHVVSFGENISSRIVAALVEGAQRADSLGFVKTEKWLGKNIVDSDLTGQLIQEAFNSGFDRVIVPGFISTDKENGEITNLGRGGSDFTGALIAAAMDARVLEIWTDVDGFMTADPRIVKSAKVIDNLSFSESMELCTFGAKVVYPPTIYPVFHKNIPIRILNTFNLDAPGTLITDSFEKPADMPVKGVTSLKKIALISLESKENKDKSKVNSRALNILSKNGIRIFPIKNDENSEKTEFAISEDDLANTVLLLNQEFAPEISSGLMLSPNVNKDLTIIAVVGTGLKSDSRISARIINTLQRENIGVVAYSVNSDSTLTFILDSVSSEDALKIIHNLIFG